MRYSSMKSTVATLTVAVTLIAAAPAASARTQSPRDNRTAVRENVRQDRSSGIRQFVNRALRRIAAHTGITIPVPDEPPVKDPKDGE